MLSRYTYKKVKNLKQIENGFQMTDYSSKSMTEQAIAIHENQVSPKILLEQFFENIEKEPNSKNIFSEIFYKDALSEAKNSEDRQKKGRRKSFFDGIVINWKDLFDIKKKNVKGEHSCYLREFLK